MSDISKQKDKQASNLARSAQYTRVIQSDLHRLIHNGLENQINDKVTTIYGLYDTINDQHERLESSLAKFDHIRAKLNRFSDKHSDLSTEVLEYQTRAELVDQDIRILEGALRLLEERSIK